MIETPDLCEACKKDEAIAQNEAGQWLCANCVVDEIFTRREPERPHHD